VRKFVLLGLGAEAKLIDMVDDLSQIVPAGDLVLDLPEDLPDLVLNGTRPTCLLLEPMQMGEELLIGEVAEVVTRPRPVVVDLALSLGAAHSPQRYCLSRMKVCARGRSQRGKPRR
jgi:hypothetical protein